MFDTKKKYPDMGRYWTEDFDRRDGEIIEHNGNLTLIRDRELLATAMITLALIGSANAAMAPLGDNPIGWVKSDDIKCGILEKKIANECIAMDHHTDAHQKGVSCATYGIPVYDRPNGKPIGLLWNDDMPIIRGDQYQGYSFVYFNSSGRATMDENGQIKLGETSMHTIMPYSLEALKSCG